MKSNKQVMKKLIVSIFLFFITTIIALAYLLSIIVSESVSYEKGSLEYYLLTTEIIKELPFTELEDANYFYSTADGNKPVENVVEFSTTKPISALSEYLIANKFKLLADGSYENGSQIIYIEYSENEKKQIKITVLEYLN